MARSKTKKGAKLAKKDTAMTKEVEQAQADAEKAKRFLNSEPFVIRKAKTHSYMGEECERLVKGFLAKLGNPEKEQALILQTRNAEQHMALKEKDGLVFQY